jgi:Subtilase family
VIDRIKAVSVATPAYPANYSGVVSVGATDQNDRLASFSNFGQTVDIAAPGVAIPSAYRGGTASLSGTSMAAPHVAASVALLLSANPTISANGAIDRLLSSADTIPGLNVENSRRLNAGRALGGNVLPPTAPRLSSDNIFRTSIDLRWTASENVTQYRVSRLVNGQWQQVGPMLSAATTKLRVSNLSAGWTVKFRVEAINSIGRTLSNILTETLRS